MIPSPVERRRHAAATVGRVVVSCVVGSTGLLAIGLALLGGLSGGKAIPPIMFGAAHLIGSWLLWPSAADLGLE
jgi:hypothetical protein